MTKQAYTSSIIHEGKTFVPAKVEGVPGEDDAQDNRKYDAQGFEHSNKYRSSLAQAPGSYANLECIAKNCLKFFELAFIPFKFVIHQLMEKMRVVFPLFLYEIYLQSIKQQ